MDLSKKRTFVVVNNELINPKHKFDCANPKRAIYSAYSLYRKKTGENDPVILTIMEVKTGKTHTYNCCIEEIDWSTTIKIDGKDHELRNRVKIEKI